MSNVNIVSARAPTKYGGNSSTWNAPTPSWMSRTWVITHSTVKAKYNAKNSRITYSASKPGLDGKIKLSHTSKLESKNKVSTSTATSIAARKADAVGEWDAKRPFKSTKRWEVLGWGDITDEKGETVESWMIVYHAATTTTEEGVDVLSSRKEGMGSETAQRCITALKGLPSDARKLRNSVVMDLKVVEISGPWKE